MENDSSANEGQETSLTKIQSNITPVLSESRKKELRFSYFPTAYKMSVVNNDEKLAQDCLTPLAAVKEQPESCVNLRLNETVMSNKRKYSEMIRLDKLDKDESAQFHIPPTRGSHELSARKRINKLVWKKQGRGRFMTETAWMIDQRTQDESTGNNQSYPTNLAELKLNSIQVLRDKACEKPKIGKVLATPFNKSSIGNSSRKPSITSTNSKIVSVVILKREDPERDKIGFNRLRLQTY